MSNLKDYVEYFSDIIQEAKDNNKTSVKITDKPYCNLMNDESKVSEAVIEWLEEEGYSVGGINEYEPCYFTVISNWLLVSWKLLY